MLKRVSLFVAALAVASTVGCGRAHPPAARTAATSISPVVATAANEEGPAAADGALAWMQSTHVNPIPPRSTSNVFVRADGRTLRVNPPGTHAQTGGLDKHRLVVEIEQGGRSRLALYGLSNHRVTYLPPYINDGAWLWRPDIDGRRLLYGAIVPGTSAVLRYEIRVADLVRGTVRVLARLDGHAEYAAPGQVRGEWATWVACPESTCNVWRENLTTGEADSAPDPQHLVYTQLGPAVDGHGVVYFERTLASCGNAEIRRWDGRRDTLVRRLPSGRVYQYAYLARGTHALYLDLGGCGRAAPDDIDVVDVSG